MTVWKGVPPEVQARLTKNPATLRGFEGFAHAVGRRLVMEEVAVSERAKDGKLQARLTYTTTVEEDMVNQRGTLHGGCAAYLVDVCSSVALLVLAHTLGKQPFYVSQAINTTFHAPAPRGARIEIINTTVSFGARTVSAVTEIWDVTNNRLCVTGVHNKMAPSQPRL
ncbi:HotDog domain-containing protein [Daedaleopsis nitida]|nr:HotDog domain-containing protein [Daedaleopsis nitida]